MGVARFWREISPRYNLIGIRCDCCGKCFFPPEQVCPECMRRSIGRLKEVQFSGKGKVVTYSVVRVPLEDFKLQIPYIMAIVELDEGAQLTAQIVDCEPDRIEIGTRVEAVFRKIREDGKEGAIYYGYKFRPIHD